MGQNMGEYMPGISCNMGQNMGEYIPGLSSTMQMLEGRMLDMHHI